MIRLTRFWFRNPTNYANSVDISNDLIYLLPIIRLLFSMLGDSSVVNIRKRVISLGSDHAGTLLKGIELKSPPMSVPTLYNVSFNIFDLLLFVLIKFK
jgi:hypothetical protein